MIPVLSGDHHISALQQSSDIRFGDVVPSVAPFGPAPLEHKRSGSLLTDLHRCPSRKI
jgi:hypothetical protein